MKIYLKNHLYVIVIAILHLIYTYIYILNIYTMYKYAYTDKKICHKKEADIIIVSPFLIDTFQQSHGPVLVNDIQTLSPRK